MTTAILVITVLTVVAGASTFVLALRHRWIARDAAGNSQGVIAAATTPLIWSGLIFAALLLARTALIWAR